ncbi:unnamed protein product [Protopolystoma xenopodis]|uniref:Uncharacterized protein n=1 Tax=Protopolystoma xenopodis TaxID=117903 RepID=A0A3S5FCJ6_9PLAT|nr:unnamed protein product [Protopolystoma xenopodis]
MQHEKTTNLLAQEFIASNAETLQTEETNHDVPLDYLAQSQPSSESQIISLDSTSSSFLTPQLLAPPLSSFFLPISIISGSTWGTELLFDIIRRFLTCSEENSLILNNLSPTHPDSTPASSSSSLIIGQRLRHLSLPFAPPLHYISCIPGMVPPIARSGFLDFLTDLGYNNLFAYSLVSGALHNLIICESKSHLNENLQVIYE